MCKCSANVAFDKATNRTETKRYKTRNAPRQNERPVHAVSALQLCPSAQPLELEPVPPWLTASASAVKAADR